MGSIQCTFHIWERIKVTVRVMGKTNYAQVQDYACLLNNASWKEGYVLVRCSDVGSTNRFCTTAVFSSLFLPSSELTLIGSISD